ncbi:hypothetical protein [Bordetella sp. 02P26C-1]|uniref:hypothetical protein n=1 Tax=Bordetella sp. 02P26C-1 TaxID=2683195 RepID=UPI001355A46E|nr:hypothetical protein [Bordetella sp. 02P26C-1]MVW79462.1 hypothetical protein [Bordetella sp. 02P26C-1]
MPLQSIVTWLMTLTMSLASPAIACPAPMAEPERPLAITQATEIRSQVAYERLVHNRGITLQWLWSDNLGRLQVTNLDGFVSLAGSQVNQHGAVHLQGDVVSIDNKGFAFRGTILIEDAPEPGRRCERTGDFYFKASGKRRFWRLQQMQSCDHFTDYVDIYY